MESKKSAKERFLDRNFGVLEDWDKHMAKQIPNGKEMLKLQEEFGNRTNYELGREMWYSNDFFINSLVLNFITDAEESGENELVNELKNIYVGMLNKPGINAEALNMDEEFDGYLINIYFDMEIQLTLISRLVSCYLYGLHPRSNGEWIGLLTEMVDNLVFLVDKLTYIQVAKARMNDEDRHIDFDSHKLHIETDLFVAGMSFIIGHEIGHHFLKHTESIPRNIVSRFIPTNVTSNQMHLDEFAADNFGFDLVIKGMKIRNKNTLFSPLMVLLMLALGDEKPEEPSQNHPSPRDRYLNLLSRLSEYDEEIALSLQLIFNDLATWIYDDDIFSKKKGYWDTVWWE
ncbi:hypothetical protein [Bacillus sp. Au-Bac7]|uniref:hypothetical protein n=1 Tax=Bacillus sp. Au-Bac7 TaxID=2906458 RepID=UPI001E3769F6|nr:hypothetical protein [Bacillus sp. Au-Bac7]MCE4052105.1 hypothetical protein [Bacillus sp. Au-Bac7]